MHRMSTKPARPDDDDDDATPYGVAFEAPHVPPPIDYPPEDDEFVAPADAPRKKKRKRRPDGVGEVPPEHRDRLLEREELPPATPWWTEAAIVAAVGALLTLISVVVIAVGVEKANFAVGVFLLVGVTAAVVVQTVAVTAFLVVAGNLFGINYGPVVEAITRLVAVVLLVNGVTLAGCLWFVPVGLVVGSLFGVPVFWWLFKLSLHDTLISVGIMAVPSWVLAALVFAAMVTKKMPQ